VAVGCCDHDSSEHGAVPALTRKARLVASSQAETALAPGFQSCERRCIVGDELLEANALRNGEIAFDHVDSGLRLRGRLLRVVSQETDKNTAFCEHARRFRAHLAGGGYGIMAPSLEISITLEYTLILVLA